MSVMSSGRAAAKKLMLRVKPRQEKLRLWRQKRQSDKWKQFAFTYEWMNASYAASVGFGSAEFEMNDTILAVCYHPQRSSVTSFLGCHRLRWDCAPHQATRKMQFVWLYPHSGSSSSPFLGIGTPVPGILYESMQKRIEESKWSAWAYNFNPTVHFFTQIEMSQYSKTSTIVMTSRQLKNGPAVQKLKRQSTAV